MARKSIPTFTSEADEQEFWQKRDSTDYIDWSKAKIGVFPELKPSTKTISLRVPESLLDAIKTLANKKDVSYQVMFAAQEGIPCQSLISSILYKFASGRLIDSAYDESAGRTVTCGRSR